MHENSVESNDEKNVFSFEFQVELYSINWGKAMADDDKSIAGYVVVLLYILIPGISL